MTVTEHLELIKNSIIENLKDILVEEDINACGGLTESIAGKISPFAIEISFLERGVFVDKGTKPHPVSREGVENITQWIKCKGLNVSPWQIVKSINEKGTMPHPWLNEFEETLLDYSDEVLQLTNTYIEEAEIYQKVKRAFGDYDYSGNY